MKSLIRSIEIARLLLFGASLGTTVIDEENIRKRKGKPEQYPQDPALDDSSKRNLIIIPEEYTRERTFGKQPLNNLFQRVEPYITGLIYNRPNSEGEK